MYYTSLNICFNLVDSNDQYKLKDVNSLNKIKQALLLILLLVNVFSPTVYANQASETTNATEYSAQMQPLFNERALDDDSTEELPQATVDVGLSVEELREAMINYYKEDFSPEEKAENQQEIDPDRLAELIEELEKIEWINSLKPQLDQVSFTVDGNTLYALRIIIPMSYQNAEALHPNHDIQLLNEVFTYSRNHLVLLGYYDEAKQIVTPLHLTTQSSPLFYNEAIDE